MKYLMILRLLVGSSLTSASVNSEAKVECRHHYLELITTNSHLSNLKGGDQVEFYLHPESVVKKFNLDLSDDPKFQACLVIEKNYN